MTRALVSIAWHGYALATLAYLAYLVRQWRALPIIGRTLVGLGLIIHALALASALVSQKGLPLGIAQGLSMLAFLLLAIFLALDLRYRMPVIGAFLTPVAVAVMLPSLLMSSETGPVPNSLKRPLLPLHVSIALLGLAAFAVATGVAVMYLLLDRQMKGKRFGLLFSRLPSLRFLDELNRLLVVWGFVALSITLVTGAFFASTTYGVFWQWESKEIATLVAWAIFALLLAARFFAGWRGRRVAVLTMAGFGLLLVSFFTSYNPSQYGGVLR
jgi:ABC-type uncharacterized transport system permease subunit